MCFFGIQVENASVDEITMIYICFYSKSFNPSEFLPNTRIGYNHFLISARAFGLLSARAGIWFGRSFAPWK